MLSFLPEQVDMLYAKLIEERARVTQGFDRHLQEALQEGGTLSEETDMAQRSTEQAYLMRFARQGAQAPG